MYPGVGAFVLIRPAQTFYERINLRIDPMELPSTRDDADLLADLLENISSLPRRYKVIFVDTISNLVVDREGKSTIDFFIV